MTLADVRAALYEKHVQLAAALTKLAKGEFVAEYEYEPLQRDIDNLLRLEHALERVEALAYAKQEDKT